MKKKSYFAFIFLLLCGLFLSLQARAEESPWQWELSLQDAADPSVMNLPTALYVDKSVERYYVVDSGNNRLLAYNRKGDFLNAFSARNNLHVPFDLIREPGLLWIVEKGQNTLTKIELKKKKITPKTISDRGEVVFPDRLAMEKETLYLLDKAKGNILALDKNVNVVRRYSCKNCDSGFVDFKIKKDRIWALEQQEKAVYVFTLDGKQETKIKLAPDEIDFPRSLAIDDNDLLYILDRHKGTVAIFDVNGAFKYSFLKKGQARGQLYYPIEISFDPWGRLCVVDEGNGRVQIFKHK